MVSEESFLVLFPEVRTPELLAKLVDVVSSSGGSNWNPQAPTIAACSSSRLVGAYSSVPVIAPQAMVVVSPSFAADLNRSSDREVGIIDTAPVSLQGGTPNDIDDVLRDDDDDDDVEPDIISDDSGDDIVASNLAGDGRASSSGTQQGEFSLGFGGKGFWKHSLNELNSNSIYRESISNSNEPNSNYLGLLLGSNST
ncbi:hypothetical protein Ahy_B01g056407 [Arachis hypogaea]|uniref:Uncharacterized protein n=1 Tax=Arachis hypogaea TaxID=3818 RepID=A0A445AYU7_ARAHY|nr:hypothetical protein Ahy_B01g056407 [Arachis hypogaea]